MLAPSIWSSGAISSATTCRTRCLRLVQSSISDMARLPNSGRRRDPARLLDVVLQLFDQLRGAAERPRLAQPLQEIDRQRLAVQVAVKADQVDLDLVGVLAEGRV